MDETLPRWFRTFLLMLWRSKGWVVVVTILLGVAISLYVVFVRPKSYEATATLVVAPPPFRAQTNDEIAVMMPKPLEVEDYRLLVGSDAVRQLAVESLRGRSAWPEDVIERLQDPKVYRECMEAETEVIKKTPQDVKYSVVITLTARAHSPERAEQLVQAWAEAALTTVKESSGGTSRFSLSFLEGEYSDVSKELEKAEIDLNTCQKDYDYQILDYQNETATLFESMDRETAQILDKYADETDIAVQTHEDETDSLLEQFDNETAIMEKSFKNATDIALERLENETDLIVADFDTLSDKMLAEFEDYRDEELSAFDIEQEIARKELVATLEKRIRELEARLQLELSQAEAGLYKEMIVEYDDALIRLCRKINDTKATLAELESELERHPPVLTVSKAVTNDALWEKVDPGTLGGGLPEELDAVKLRSEELNPVYGELVSKIAESRVELKALPASEKFLLEDRKAKREDFAELMTTMKDKEFRLKEMSLDNELELFKFDLERDIDRQKLQRELDIKFQELKRNRQTARLMLERGRTTQLEIKKRERKTQLALLLLEREMKRRKLERGRSTELAAVKRERATGLRVLEAERETKREVFASTRETEQRILEREAVLEEKRLERLVSHRETKYSALASKYLSARLAIADKSTDLVQVGSVAVSNEPAGVPTSASCAAGFVFAFFVGVGAVLLNAGIRTMLAFMDKLRQIETAEAMGGSDESA